MTNTFKKPILDDATDLLDINLPIYKEKIAEAQIPIVKALQDARIKAKKSLIEISQSLRISQDYLKAIESADLEALPERVYTLGFVRSYARYLEFDIDDTIQRFKSEVLGDVVNANYSMPKPINGNALPNQFLIWLITVLVIGCGIGGLYYLNSNTPPITEKSQVPEIIRQEIQAATPAENAPMESRDSLSASQQDTTEPLTAAPSSSVATAPMETAESTPTGAADLSTSASPSVTPENASPSITEAIITSHEFNLKFTELSWVEVKDENGMVILNRTFKPGEIYTLTLKPGMLFTTGNAGGIQVMTGADESFTLGKKGEILKNLSGDSSRFKQP